MRLTLKAVNDELAKRGHTARLAKGGNYFYFQYGEAEDLLDRTANVPTANSLSLPEWMAEFGRLKKLNAKIMGGKGGKPTPKRKQTNFKP